MKEKDTEIKRSARKPLVSEDKLSVLVTIVNRRKADFYTDIIQSYDANLQMLVAGEGTLKILSQDLLNLVSIPKTIIFSVIQKKQEEKILVTLEDKFNSIKDGEGIAFTIPMSSVIGKLVYGFLSNQQNLIGGQQNG
ncbi:MAG: hypothetical protein IJR83_06680 [Clostridia bacterium]|nr:hypothetical protein [Clostridia bacterium]